MTSKILLKTINIKSNHFDNFSSFIYKFQTNLEALILNYLFTHISKMFKENKARTNLIAKLGASKSIYTYRIKGKFTE